VSGFKCASSHGAAQMGPLAFAQPCQLGVGVAGGCEAAVHSARRYLQTLEPDYIMVKLDFANTFNSLYRSEMLLAIRDYLPELYAFCFSSISQPSRLYFGSYIIPSQEDTQQGDPLGPLLFRCAVLFSTHCSLISHLVISMISHLLAIKTHIGVNTGGTGGRVPPPEFVVGDANVIRPPRFWPVGHMLCNESLSSAEVPGLTYSSPPGSRCGMTRINLAPLRPLTAVVFRSDVTASAFCRRVVTRQLPTGGERRQLAAKCHPDVHSQAVLH